MPTISIMEVQLVNAEYANPVLELYVALCRCTLIFNFILFILYASPASVDLKHFEVIKLPFD